MNLPCVSFFDIYKSTTGMRSVESLQNHHWALKPYALIQKLSQIIFKSQKFALSCLQQAEERNFFTSFSRNLGFVDLPIPVDPGTGRIPQSTVAVAPNLNLIQAYQS